MEFSVRSRVITFVSGVILSFGLREEYYWTSQMEEKEESPKVNGIFTKYGALPRQEPTRIEITE